MTAKIKLKTASGGGSFSLQAPSSSSNNRVMTLPDSADGTILTTTNPKAGNIIQVQHAYKGDRFTTTSEVFTDITGLSITITPSSSSNKILLICHMGAAGTQQSDLDHGQAIRVQRSIGGGNFSDDNKLNGAADGQRKRISFKGVGWSFNTDHMPGGVGFSGVDDPNTTSATIYKVQVAAQQAAYPFVLNGNTLNTNQTQVYNARSFSSLIAMEIAG
tara:strand:+ start:239 stop:889 length:651 start_codon:yes stop_codon:yes gene_type:complete